MLRFIVKRLFWMVPSLFLASFLAFVLIQLPPGDYVTTYIATLAASNETIDQNTAIALRERFGLDQPMLSQLATDSGSIFQPFTEIKIALKTKPAITAPMDTPALASRFRCVKRAIITLANKGRNKMIQGNISSCIRVSCS